MSNYFSRKKKRNKLSNARGHVRPDHSLYSQLGRDPHLDDSDDDSTVIYVYNDETENEVLQLRDRNAVTGKPKPTPHIEREVREGDTLIGLALRYGCTVAELKRQNNLINNQEFHALTKIKIPIKPYSVLTEANHEPTPGTSADNPEQDVHVRTLSIGASLLNGRTDAFLRHMDEDLERIRKATCQYKSSLEEVAAELTCKRFHPLAQTNSVNGIHLRSVLCIGALIILIIPIGIIVYIELLKEKE